jgi:hypothetical protein
MDTWTELLEPLLANLPPDDRLSLLQRIELARDEQLESKLHPRKRQLGSRADRTLPSEQVA